MEQKVKRTKTPEQALVSLMNLCAKSERCTGDARRLMRGWGVAAADGEKVLQRLVAEQFIDDSRYAEAFVREKINLSGWGAYKITATLRHKGSDKASIASALEQYSDVDTVERQGYDFSTAREVVERLVKSDNQCDELDF